jgi:cation diffusion facilitator CzcD-associated flavoprotein CzcO
MRHFLFLCFATWSAACAPKTETLNTQVLVIGGGASGTPAAIQAARLGADVVVVEWATEYEPLWGEPATLLVGKRTVFHAAMTLPDTPTPGFPVFEKRMIMVGEK